jgi:hypothetical protein
MNNPIRIFDSSLNLVTELDDYASAYFNRSWSGCGDFSIQTNYNTTHAADLVRGRIVMFDKNVKKCGIITNVKRAIGESGKGSQIVTATGIELKGILGWRIVPPLSGAEYYTISNSAETVMKTLVSQNGGPTTADADRKFTLLEIDTDADLGATYLLKTRYTSNVLAECTACSLATETGFYIYLDLSNKKYRFQTAQGLDRSGSQSVNPRAIFSTDYDTLKSASIDDNDANFRNYAFVGGQGEGINRTVREVYTGTAEPTGLDRREMFVDARDVPLNADLDLRGGQKLEELATIITVDGSPLSYSPLVYGTDYDLGDIATLSTYDESRDVRITSVKESWAPLAYNIDMTFDRLPQTLQTQVQSAVSSVKNSLNSVGGTIIESGSNANGSYIKFGDGTMEQWGWGYVTGDGLASINASITLPTSFHSTNYIPLAHAIGYKTPGTPPSSPADSAGNTLQIVSGARIAAGNSIIIQWLAGLGGVTVMSLNYFFLHAWSAIGRWKA